MTGWKLFLTSWEFEPSVVLGCALLLGIYLYFVRFKVNGKTVNFTLGVLVIFLALVSPLDELGDHYLFSAHMIQHILLGMFAPPLLVAGLPETFVRAWLRFPLIARLERILGYPPLAVFIGTATFWVWHLPVLWEATQASEAVHVFEHLTFLVTGTMLWWPVLKPIPEGRLSPMPAIIYLNIAGVLNAILGIILTIADTTFYPGYAHPQDVLGALSLIREKWGLTQLIDQKLGGAVMWALGGLVYLWVMMVVMVNWCKDFETDSGQSPERRRENAET